MINNITNTNPDLMCITWEIMNTCNYACSYCSPALHRGDKPMPKYDDALEFFKYIDSEVYSGPKLLSMTGSEPTLWPKLIDFLDELPENYYTEIITNASRTVRWWKMITEKSIRLDRINISVHLEYAEKDHILKVCEILQNDFSVHVMILFDLDYIDKAVDIAKTLLDSGVKISCRFKPIVLKKTEGETKYTSNYLNEHKEIIAKCNFNNMKKSHINYFPTGFVVNGEYKPPSWGQQLISSNQHSFTGMFCEAGVKRLHIDFKGNVFPATCTTGYNVQLGRIKDRKLKKIDGLLCDAKYCSCVPDMRIPKWRLNND